MSSMGEWALHYRSMGLSVFPVKSGDKLPLIKWKTYQERLPSEEEIKTWWETWPEADIGCVTGAISGRLVLDIDGEEGFSSVKDFPLSVSNAVRTRRGKQIHYQYSGVHDTTTTVAGILPGVDVRGDGGYVKLPPSLCSDNTRYEWLQSGVETPLAEPPGWLLDLLLKNRPKVALPEQKQTEAMLSKQRTKLDIKEPHEHWLSDIIDGVGEGDRHGALIKLSGYYFNVFPAVVAVQHLRAWNEKNSPPIETEEFEIQLQDLKGRFANGEYDSTFKEPQTPRVPEIISVGALTEKYNKAPDYLVPGLIPKATRTIFAGWQGRGKSYAMTDLVIEISRKAGEGKWLGTFPVKSGPVIYVDNENAANLVSWRVSQLLIPKRMGTTDLDLHFVLGNHWKMTNAQDYQWLRTQVEAIKPVLVVVDSLASCHTMDENSSRDMRIFFDDLVAPFCEEFQCGFLCIDHERKDTMGLESSGGKRLRGSSAKGDAVDTILSLNEDREGKVYLEHSKSRYGRKHQPFGIELEYLTEGARLKANV